MHRRRGRGCRAEEFGGKVTGHCQNPVSRIECPMGLSHTTFTDATPVRLIFSFIMAANNKAEGRREDALVKQRTQMREDFERQKQTLINETEKARPSANRFVGQNDSMEDTLKNSTVGLVRLEEFQQRRKELEEAKAREAARSSELKYVSFLISLSLCFFEEEMAYRLWRIFLETTQERQRSARNLHVQLSHLLSTMMKRHQGKHLAT